MGGNFQPKGPIGHDYDKFDLPRAGTSSKLKENSRYLTKEKLRPHDYAVYDHDNPNSLWARVSNAGKIALDSVPVNYRTFALHILERKIAEEIDLGGPGVVEKKAMLAPGVGLSAREGQLRISLWREYQIAIDQGKKISMEGVCRGICDVKTFYGIFKNKLKTAWLATPPADYTSAMQELLDLSVRQLRDILTVPMYNAKGEPLAAVMQVKLRAHEMVENRVRGINPQTFNINQKSINMNFNDSAGSAFQPRAPDDPPAPLPASDPSRFTKPIDTMSISELEAEIATRERSAKIMATKAKNRAALGEPETIDIVPTKMPPDPGPRKRGRPRKKKD